MWRTDPLQPLDFAVEPAGLMRVDQHLQCDIAQFGGRRSPTLPRATGLAKRFESRQRTKRLCDLVPRERSTHGIS